MRNKIVPVSNIVRLSDASDALLNREPSLPGMGLIYGDTGLGKSTAVTWLTNRNNGVHIRAYATSTPSSLLRTIARELDLEPQRSNVETVEAIVRALAESGRPLFVDEADYLVAQQRTVETLRDIHDMSTVPVVLIGMTGIQRKLKSRPQLVGRIAQWVEFKPITLADLRVMARDLCEVGIAEDLLAHLHDKTQGSIRHAAVGMKHIEMHGKAGSIETMTLADWPRHKPFTLAEARAA